MPMGEVAEHAKLANMMEAQERLGYIMDTAAGTGSLKKGRGRQHVRDLQRQARGRRPPRAELEEAAAPSPRTIDEAAAELAAFGIKVEVVGG